MKKILLSLCLVSACFAAKQQLAKTPTSSPFYVDLSLEKCDDTCLYNLLYEGAFLSFLARFSSTNEQLYNYYSKLSNGIENFILPARARNKAVKIALVLPEAELKSYASNIAAPVLAYLIAKNQDAQMKVFFTGYEKTSAKLIADLADFSLIITGFRKQALLELAAAVPNARVYSPLANANDFANPGENLYFGSIDYGEQIAKLSAIATQNVGVFKDTSALANMLSEHVRQNKNITFARTVEPKNYNATAALNGAYALNGKSVFFNLPLVKTTLLATQMHALNIRAHNFLSTQINYHPMFLNLAQPNERDRFYFASIISQVSEQLEYTNDLLGQKISYNWIVYSTSAGLDELYNQVFYADDAPLFSERFEGRKMIFHSKIMSAKNSKFSEVR